MYRTPPETATGSGAGPTGGAWPDWWEGRPPGRPRTGHGKRAGATHRLLPPAIRDYFAEEEW